MDNRDRDKMNKNTDSTSGDDVNRNTTSQIGKNKSDSTAGFDPKSGRTDNLNEPNSRTGKSGSSGFESAKSPRLPSDDKSTGNGSPDSKTNDSKNSNR